MQLHWTGAHHPARDKQLSSPDLSTCRSTTASLPATLLLPSTRRVTAQTTWGQKICKLLHISFSWKQTCITETLQLRVKHSTAQFLHSGSVQSHTFFIHAQLKHGSSTGPHKPTRQGPCASFWPAQDPQTEEANAERTHLKPHYSTKHRNNLPLEPEMRADTV